MQAFRDSKDRRWEIDLTFGAVLRIKGASSDRPGGAFDLLDDTTGKLGQNLWSDLGEFYEVLWLLVEPQARSQNITADDFGEAIAADCIIDARQKFFTEYIAFFQNLQRPETAKVLEKMLSLNRRAHQLSVAKMEAAMGPEFDQKAEAKINQAVNLAFGNLADSLDKTLALTPGDNST